MVVTREQAGSGGINGDFSLSWNGSDPVGMS